ncbi:hypothetical protein [Nocardia sp. CA-120079]|uniref:hypothetical protein n=1 Tax=Nocardia sp. CA-120079 TaxID=3239974 RepID=UPI003D95BD30
MLSRSGFIWVADRCDVGAAEITVSGLPTDYRDILEVLADAGRVAVRACRGRVGLDGEDRSTVELLRSKLKRLVARNWLSEEMPGLFVLPDDVNVTA